MGYDKPTPGKPLPPGPPHPGHPHVPPETYIPPAPTPTNPLAVVSLVFGIAAGVLGCCCWMHIPLGLAATVTGIVGMLQTQDNRESGFVLAAIGTFLGVAFLVFYTLLAILSITLQFTDFRPQF